MNDLTTRHATIAKLPLIEARLQGLPLYWSGKPCPHGHLEYRVTRNHECMGCVRRKNRSTPDQLIQAHKRREIEIRLEQLELEREYDYE